MADEEERKKPNLKVVYLQDKRNEIQELINEEKDSEERIAFKFQSRAMRLYSESRELFSEMVDYEVQQDAIKNLRKAFLLALNPLSKIDQEYDYLEIIEVNSDESDD